MIVEKYFCLTFLSLLFVALFFSDGCEAQTDVLNSHGMWRHIPITSNKQAMYYFNNGFRLYKKTKMKDAVVQFDQAIKLDPKCAEFYFRRGDSFLELDKLNEAYCDFTKTIELEPRCYPAFKRRARLNYERGKFAEALKDYASAEKAAPNLIEKAEILKLKAKMHSSMKQYDLSITEFTRSLAIDRSGHGLMLRGNQYFAIRQYKKAVDDYTEAIAMKVARTLVHYARRCFRKNGTIGSSQKRQERCEVTSRRFMGFSASRHG